MNSPKSNTKKKNYEQPLSSGSSESESSDDYSAPSSKATNSFFKLLGAITNLLTFRLQKLESERSTLMSVLDAILIILIIIALFSLLLLADIIYLLPKIAHRFQLFN